jgi:hypothetical protein
MSPARDVIVDVRCPTCGNDGEAGAIRYVVDDQVASIVLIPCYEGVLVLDRPAPSSTRNERPTLECRAVLRRHGPVCATRWPLPTAVTAITWRVAP